MKQFPLHVAAGAIFNEHDEVLLALRPAHAHQGGLWEFPGGKVEPGETVLAALQRELNEELGIQVSQARPLITVDHVYPDKRVLLDVWRVDAYAGLPASCEGQLLEWAPVSALRSKQFPAANLPVITAVQLPSLYLITPEPGKDFPGFLHTLELCLHDGVRLVQLRAKTLDEQKYRQLACQALELCQRYQAQLLLNASPEFAQDLDVDGVHLSSERLLRLTDRPMTKDKWVAASCHNPAELAHAIRTGVDFVVVSPVLPTRSHPGAPLLGWEGLRQFTALANLPVYALGGMRREHIASAHRHGAQGVAAIRSVWNDD